MDISIYDLSDLLKTSTNKVIQISTCIRSLNKIKEEIIDLILLKYDTDKYVNIKSEFYLNKLEEFSNILEVVQKSTKEEIKESSNENIQSSLNTISFLISIVKMHICLQDLQVSIKQKNFLKIPDYILHFKDMVIKPFHDNKNSKEVKTFICLKTSYDRLNQNVINLLVKIWNEHVIWNYYTIDNVLEISLKISFRNQNIISNWKEVLACIIKLKEVDYLLETFIYNLMEFFLLPIIYKSVECRCKEDCFIVKIFPNSIFLSEQIFVNLMDVFFFIREQLMQINENIIFLKVIGNSSIKSLFKLFSRNYLEKIILTHSTPSSAHNSLLKNLQDFQTALEKMEFIEIQDKEISSMIYCVISEIFTNQNRKLVIETRLMIYNMLTNIKSFATLDPSSKYHECWKPSEFQSCIISSCIKSLSAKLLMMLKRLKNFEKKKDKIQVEYEIYFFYKYVHDLVELFLNLSNNQCDYEFSSSSTNLAIQHNNCKYLANSLMIIEIKMNRTLNKYQLPSQALFISYNRLNKLAEFSLFKMLQKELIQISSISILKTNIPIEMKMNEIELLISNVKTSLNKLQALLKSLDGVLKDQNIKHSIAFLLSKTIGLVINQFIGSSICCKKNIPFFHLCIDILLDFMNNFCITKDIKESEILKYVPLFSRLRGLKFIISINKTSLINQLDYKNPIIIQNFTNEEIKNILQFYY